MRRGQHGVPRDLVVADAELLVDVPPDVAAARIGMTPAAIARALQRARRYDLARPYQALHERTRHHRRTAA